MRARPTAATVPSKNVAMRAGFAPPIHRGPNVKKQTTAVMRFLVRRIVAAMTITTTYQQSKPVSQVNGGVPPLDIKLWVHGFIVNAHAASCLLYTSPSP